MSPTVRRQTLFILVFLVVVLIFVTMFRMGVVRGESMEPTYHNGQVVLVRRRNWFSAPLHRNDVVLLRKDRDVLIKRIYRLPGEEVDDTFPDVLAFSRMNGLTDYYEQKTEQTPGGSKIHYRVPDNYLVILGDNLRVSEDSRIFGPVPMRDVLGVVVNAPGPPYSPNTRMPDRFERPHRGQSPPPATTGALVPPTGDNPLIVARRQADVNTPAKP